MTISPRNWRTETNLTMEGAARLVGVLGKNPARTWQRWEQGQLEPPLAIVQAVARVSEGAVSLESWRAVREQYLSAACTASPDDSSGHAGGSSPDPNFETEQSPQLSHERGDRSRAPAPGV